MDDYNLEAMFRKKNELLRKIEEKKRMMELIKNPNIRNTLLPAKQMQKNISARKIQVTFKIFILELLEE